MITTNIDIERILDIALVTVLLFRKSRKVTAILKQYTYCSTVFYLNKIKLSYDKKISLSFQLHKGSTVPPYELLFTLIIHPFVMDKCTGNVILSSKHD